MTSSNDNSVLEWTYRTDVGNLASSSIGGHDDWVRDAAWAPNVGLHQEIVASCSEDKMLKIWKKAAPGKWENIWSTKLDGPGWRVGWSPSGGVLSVTAGDKTILYKQILGSDEFEEIESISD